MKERLDAYVEGGITLPVLTADHARRTSFGELIEALAPASLG